MGDIEVHLLLVNSIGTSIPVRLMNRIDVVIAVLEKID
jgi:hypothetical protein